MASSKELALDWAQVRHDFKYVKSTGKLYRVDEGATREVGSLTEEGYLQFRFKGAKFMVHRVAWFWVKGEWPVEIDHADRNRSRNVWSNLRNKDHQFNMQNRRVAQRNSKTGYLGVHKLPSGKYAARLGHNGRKLYLGNHGTPEAAHAVVLTTKRKLHAGCTI